MGAPSRPGPASSVVKPLTVVGATSPALLDASVLKKGGETFMVCLVESHCASTRMAGGGPYYELVSGGSAAEGMVVGEGDGDVCRAW